MKLLLVTLASIQAVKISKENPADQPEDLSWGNIMPDVGGPNLGSLHAAKKCVRWAS